MPSQEEVEKAMQEAQYAKDAQCATQDVDYGLSGMLVGKAGKSLYRPSLKNNLQQQLASHEARAAQLKRLIALLDSNPEVSEILELAKQF